MDLTTKWPFYNRFVGPINYDKWSVIKKRLRAVEVNDMTDPVRVAEVCLVPHIMVVKEFRVLDFIKYIWLEHSSLIILQHKMAEVIHVDKMLIYSFKIISQGSPWTGIWDWIVPRLINGRIWYMPSWSSIYSIWKLLMTKPVWWLWKRETKSLQRYIHKNSEIRQHMSNLC
jgi:hypothetical protein